MLLLSPFTIFAERKAMYKWDRHIIREEATLTEALRKLNDLSGKAMVLFAVDNANRMTGTITDGDIRRSLIAGTGLNSTVGETMHRAFRFLEEGNIDLMKVREMRRNKITLVPVIGKDGSIKAVYNFEECHSILPLDAVMMAGGKGERLRPLTLDTPKPLMKVGEKSIIDYNVEELARNGIDNIAVTTNYLAEQIERHFETPVGGVKVRCIREPKKLGTIGSAKLVGGLTNDNIIVMNSDILTTINYEELFIFHAEQDADMTIAAVPYMVSVPFAILHSDNFRVTGLEEKPTYNYYANAGIYIIKRRLLELIPDDTVFDATDLIESIINDGGKVVYHPIDGIWLDIGSPDDFRHAQEIVRNKRLSNL